MLLIAGLVIQGDGWLSPPAIAQAPPSAPLANHGRKALAVHRIDEMLALPEEEIDIGVMALLIAKEHYPLLDMKDYLARLDDAAREVRARIGNEGDPQRIIAILCQGTIEVLGLCFA